MTMKYQRSCDPELVIIGGGPGGLVVASVAGQLGIRTTLIERGPELGGDCLHTGCVPSKTLIHTAKVASLMRRAAEFGLPAVGPEVNFAAVMDRVRSVVDTIQAHDDPERFRGYGVDVVFGEARFIGPRELMVNDRRIRGRRFVIATGSRPSVPPVPGLEEAGYLTSDTIWSLRELPRRLAVLGAGPIGLELAQAFARLGSEVTLLEMAPRLLPAEDAEIAQMLQGHLAHEGIRIMTGVEVTRVSRDASAVSLHVRDGENTMTAEADTLLVAAGRRPDLEALNLDAAGVEHTRTGITVDNRLRTSARHIFACGDCCGPWPFTHMAEYQAGIVISNAVFRLPRRADYRVVPRVTYCDPELARVGLSETEAREQGIDVQVLRFPFGQVDRALTEGETTGEARLVVRKGRLLGATLLGPHAGELIHELVLAMKARIPISRISSTIHAYPTLAQIHRRAVNTLYGPRLFSARTRGLVRWIQRLIP
ncbi:pyridine nucleotide-disulfide oxidoreductase [Thioalkalivibrio denitrificans]|uniref:Pyridine nucleotide-disulfide oxidoreductase n=1 Tax=Thioalkalivibrio denitrificans TaxID=108003 RepID=A0A1V3NCU6_9GAMM|nr:mercuric reductase [Thioalkalivibrio denitrificans]OOG22688.1 pyridine nucleotide-disulfide oxidoreductase [Thioalkalivibrio denitrificans]